MIIFFGLCKIFLVLNIYQQAHYSIKQYLIHMIRNFLWYTGIVFMLFMLYFIPNIFLKVSSLIVINLYSFFFIFFKVHLKITKRIIRVLVLLLGLLLLTFFGDFGNALILALEYVCLPVLFFDKGVSRLINLRYLSNAQKKIGSFHGITIGVTGSCGKTSVKEYFDTALDCFYKTLATPKSYNTPLGIAKTINDNNLLEYEYLVLEMGVSHRNDMNELLLISKPNVAVITEITYMHMNEFKNLNCVFKEKVKIIEGADIVIANFENKILREYDYQSKLVLSYGFNYGMYQAKNIHDCEFDLVYKGEILVHLKSRLNGEFNILNSLAIFSYLHFLGKSIHEIERVAYLLKNTENRLNFRKYNSRYVMDDSYNSNPIGFRYALEELKKMPGKRIMITPGIVDLGKYRYEQYTNLIPYIVSSCDVVIVVKGVNDKILMKLLQGYLIEKYFAKSFKEAYRLYLKLVENEKESYLLIENDLPDLYRRGLMIC